MLLRYDREMEDLREFAAEGGEGANPLAPLAKLDGRWAKDEGSSFTLDPRVPRLGGEEGSKPSRFSKGLRPLAPPT